MTDTMWAISSGSYSDYSVYALVASKEAAERIVEQLNEGHRSSYDEYFVEDFPVITGVRREFVLRMEYRGGTDREWTTSHWLFAESEAEQPVKVEHAWHGGFVVTGTDYDRVRKVYSERRAEYRANQEGLT